MDKATKARFDALAQSGCIVCRKFHGVITPANIHHATGIQYRATGKKASDNHVLPLCHFHHQGAQGIHTIGMRTWEGMFGTQTELMEISNAIIAGQH